MTDPSSQFHLLLAEDNPVSREMACRLLVRRGHEVHAVEDGLEAWEAYLENDYDAILLDLEMPLLDGFETCRKIRNHESRADRRRTVVLALTASEEPRDQQACHDAGMDGLIPKPINIQTFNTTLTNLITASQQ